MLSSAAGNLSGGQLDELHQSYLPNRTGTPWDVLLDCTGAIALQLVLYIYLRLFKPRQLMRADEAI